MRRLPAINITHAMQSIQHTHSQSAPVEHRVHHVGLSLDLNKIESQGGLTAQGRRVQQVAGAEALELAQNLPHALTRVDEALEDVTLTMLRHSTEKRKGIHVPKCDLRLAFCRSRPMPPQ